MHLETVSYETDKHVAIITLNRPKKSMIELAKEYGPLFKMCILGPEFFLASSHAVVNELCDTERFEKDVSGPLEVFREFAGDGLFTAYIITSRIGRKLIVF